MKLTLRCVPNAFKHGVAEEEIWEVFLNETVRCAIVKYKTSPPDMIYNAYGLTESGRYLEIGYIKETASCYRVIHAMDMRDDTKKRFRKTRNL